MKILIISFNKHFTYSLLLYSWNCLKKTKCLYNFNEKNALPPISKYWLEKTAYLISQGKFDYKSCFVSIGRNNESNNSKRTIRNNFKLKIIENAFVFLLSKYLNSSLNNNNIDLIKYLRFDTNFRTLIFLT